MPRSPVTPPSEGPARTCPASLRCSRGGGCGKAAVPSASPGVRCPPRRSGPTWGGKERRCVRRSRRHRSNLEQLSRRGRRRGRGVGGAGAPARFTGAGPGALKAMPPAPGMRETHPELRATLGHGLCCRGQPGHPGFGAAPQPGFVRLLGWPDRLPPPVATGASPGTPAWHRAPEPLSSPARLRSKVYFFLLLISLPTEIFFFFLISSFSFPFPAPLFFSFALIFFPLLV